MPVSLRAGARPAALCAALLCAAPCLAVPAAFAQTAAAGTPALRRAAGAIRIDGVLDDAGWQGALTVDTWYETNPGDNVPPRVANLARLTYDDEAFYAAFEFADPDPSGIRALVAEHDNMPGWTDYGGVILDPRRDGTGAMFLANAHGVQYDAVHSDATGSEDSSPDFFWDAAGKVTAAGWQVELRIPFSSLRYDGAPAQTWGVLLYRNWPRDRRVQMFSAVLPRGGNCFVCNAAPVAGFDGLPGGDHLVVAPYVSGNRRDRPRDGLGTSLADGDPAAELGLDVKWSPSPDHVLDATVNPDFSQIEADVPQIAANERFALFFSEKRPFFLEGVDLLSTPLQAVYTRTVTAPRWGGRATGKLGSTAYTVLAAEDRGGGSVIVPGPRGSELADQDFASTVAIARLRHDVGRSFVSLLATAREVEDGGSNRVVGPDFRWTPSDRLQFTGQLLWAETETPNRPDLAGEWDGRRLAGHALRLTGWYNDPVYDAYLEVDDLDREFRADDGFIPQVGHRRTYFETGRTVRPTDRWASRWRPFVIAEDVVERDGGARLYRLLSSGVGLDGRWNSFFRLRLALDQVASGPELFDRTQVFFTAQVRPSKRVSNLYLDGRWGDDVDFAHDRPGRGGRLYFEGNLRPTERLELAVVGERRWLDVDRPAAGRGRLFTADLARLKAQYNFSSRTSLRLIGQHLETRRDPTLFAATVRNKSRDLAGSALFAYRLNWQTVVFVGYGDERGLDAMGELQPAGRELFAKVSYAWQR